MLHEAFYVATSGRPGPVVVDMPKDVQFADRHLSSAAQGPTSTSPTRPQVKGDPAQIRKAVALLAGAKRPVIYSGGGVINSGAEASQAAARAGRGHRLPDHLDADGPRRLSGVRQELARHARHARHLRGQHRDARLRRHAVHRRALRRPHHRPHRRVLAELQEDPHRHRSVVDQQERPRRRADHRRRRQCAGRPAGDVQGRGEEARHQAVVAADRDLAGAQFAGLQEEQRRDHAAIRDRAAVRGDHAAATPTSPPRSASTRCGRRSSSASRSRTAG